MNREIKFRGWNFRHNRWEYGLYVNDVLYPNSRTSHRISPSNWEVDEKSVGQFTGLKDMNQKDIYAGDIVRILYTDWASQTPDEDGNYSMTLEEYKKSKSAIGYVDWDSYSTGWIIRTRSKMSVNEDGTVMTSIIHGTHGEREVIGNIFENPELVK